MGSFAMRSRTSRVSSAYWAKLSLSTSPALRASGPFPGRG